MTERLSTESRCFATIIKKLKNKWGKCHVDKGEHAKLCVGGLTVGKDTDTRSGLDWVQSIG